MAKDAQASSHSSFQRFERVMKALIGVPKKDVEEKRTDNPRKRVKRASQKTA